MEQFIATKDDIGKLVYPFDNSYCINLTVCGGFSVPFLAGTHREKPKLVKIISAPYRCIIKPNGTYPKEYEVIHVEYNGDTFRILNIFNRESKPIWPLSFLYLDILS